MRRRSTALILGLAGALTGILILGVASSSGEGKHAARTSGTPASAAEQTDAEAGSLIERDGFADVIDPGAHEDDATLGDAPTRYWFGTANDSRTRDGEVGATVTVQSVASGRTWPGGGTRARGIFVVAVPDDLGDAGDLRLVVETHDGRMGMRSVRPPREGATDVGRIVLAGVESLRGRCIDPSGKAYGGTALQLRAFGELRAQPGAIAQTRADEHGYFEFARVPRGMYVLEGRGLDGELFLVAPITVPRHELLIAAPIATASLHVVVSNSLDRPARDLGVSATLLGPTAEQDPLGPPQILAAVATTTDATGSASLGQLPVGTYRIRVARDRDAFDFDVTHTVDQPQLVRLTIPTDARIRIQCFFADGKVARHTKLQLETPTGPEAAVTSDDGIVIVNRGLPPKAHVQAIVSPGALRGAVTLSHELLEEGQIAAELRLLPPRIMEGPEEEEGRRIPRFAIVRTPEGLPVRGARVVGGGKIARTNKEGRAALGELPDKAVIRLVRKDLASGFPTSGLLGGLTTYEFVWHPGTPVHLTVLDAEFGFHLDRGVRIGAHATAAKRVGPGQFTTRWDAHTAPPGAKLIVQATGYQSMELVPPEADVESTRQTVELERAGDGATGTLVIHVRRRGVPFVGARIHGEWFGTDRKVPGRRDVTALSADSGDAVLHGLARGPWRFDADAGDEGTRWLIIVVAPGMQEKTIDLRDPPAHVGVVWDEQKRPIEGVAVSVPEDDTRVVRTKANGYFALSPRTGHASSLELRAEKAGYTTTHVEWVRKRGQWDRKAIVMRRTERLVLPIQWGDAGTETIPGDLRFRLEVVVDGDAQPIISQARVEGQRVVAEHAPRAQLYLVQTSGSAFAPRVSIKAGEPGDPPRRRVILYRGVTVRGRVSGGSQRGAFRMVSVHTTGHEPRIAQSNENGTFELRGVPPGRIRIEVHGQTAASRARNARLEATNGDTLDVVIDLD